MATSSNEFETKINTIFNTTWSTREGRVVPKTDDVALANGAVELDAVMLYADLAHSTQLVQDFSRSVAAKVVRAFLSSMTQLVNDYGGSVRSFDGDRVMGVFVGDSKNSNAAKCALKMNYVVSKILRPKAEQKFPSLKEKGFEIKHCVGVAASKVLVVRGGVRGSNDLVFIGSAPNIAAKLSDMRTEYASYITWNVHKFLNEESKYGGEPKQDMWTATKVTMAGQTWDCFKSTWYWKP